MILYRPVGLQELGLIYDSDMKAFPTDLPQQPIFYPVVDLEYARQTASDWNVKNGELAGYVTQFKVEDQYIGKFKTHKVGNTQYKEFWIPADQMGEFNKHIVGRIKVVEAYFGDAFQGFIPDKFELQGKKAVQQFTLLSNSYIYKRMDFYLEIKRNHKAVFLNYPFWQKHNFKNPGLKEKIIQAIKEAWFTSFPQNPLVTFVQAESTLIKNLDSDSPENPIEEDNRPAKPRNAPSATRAARESVTPAKQKDTPPPVKPVQRDPTPLKPITSASPRNPREEDFKPTVPRDAQPAPKPVRENISPIQPRDAKPPIKPPHQDVSNAEEADETSFVSPIEHDAPRLEAPKTQVPRSPVREESAPPRPKDLHLLQGIELGINGNYHEAVDELIKAVEEDPNHVIAQTSLGVACHRLGEDERAFACYEAALQIDHRYADAHYFRANIFYEHGNIREAIAGYTIAIGLAPRLIDAHQTPLPQDRLTDYTDVPASIHRIAKPANRILSLDEALVAKPKEVSLFKERAAEYSRLGNYQQAIADYTAYLRIRADDANVFYLRGLAHDQLGQHEHAVKDYQQAVAINPQLPDVYINRGIEFAKTGNFYQSIASLTDGIRLVPDNPDGYFNRGITYLQQGDFGRAIDDFSSVIRISPNDDAAYYWRGVSNEEAGQRRESIADYKQFLTLSQDPRARQEIEQKLRQWNEGRRNDQSGQTATTENRRRTNLIPAKKPVQKFDLHALMLAMGERALRSTWFGAGVNCSGENAEQLYELTDNNEPIPGQDLLQITSGIRHTIEGDFTAFDPDATSHWLFIRAWEGRGFYIETNDPESKNRLKAQFQSVEDVEGVSPPYEGLFIHI